MRHCRALAALTALVAGGCSSGGGKPEPTLIEAWKVPSITAIGQPVAAGDTVVVYGTINKDLYLYGVSVADGAIRWRQAATPSLTTSGIPLTPEVVDGRVAYFRPDPKANLAARLVVAAPETGSDLLVSDAAVFRSHPGHCSDGKDVCVRMVDAGGTDVSRRFSIEAGGPVPDRGLAPPGSRSIGEHLLDLGQRQPEVLAGFQDGAVTWRSPLARHFSAGYSTDEGWFFELYKSAGVHVGSVGRTADQNDSSAVAWDVSKAQTVAIDAATGASVWRSEGTTFACNSTIRLSRRVADDRSEDWPIRCRYRGTARYDRAANTTTYEGLDVTLEGFDVLTGTTTWSLSLGAAEAFMDEEVDAPVVSDSAVLVQGASGPIIVDLAQGSTRAPGKGEGFWCARNAFLDYREPRSLPSGATSNSWRGGTLLDSCAADRSPTEVLPRQLARSLGATVGERTVIATPRGLVAFDRGG